MSGRITIDPAVCHGKPCIRGLRYPVENVLEWLASGMTTDEILQDYEDLEREDILAALSYAARLTHIKRLKMRANTIFANKLPKIVSDPIYTPSSPKAAPLLRN